MNNDELKVTISGETDASAEWRIEDAETDRNVSCRRELQVDDFIALDERERDELGMEMTHDSEDGSYQTLVNDATGRLFIRNE